MSIAIIFGGRSCEHNVSIVTGVQLLNAVRHLKPVPVYITEGGEWTSEDALFDLNSFKGKRDFRRVYPRPASKFLFNARGKPLVEITAAVLCCHGMGGEDGSIQGLLECCGIAYSGPGILQSALCLDKPQAKLMLAAHGIKSVPFFTFDRQEYNGDIYQIADKIERLGGYPLILKPARLGSSIGIGIARCEAEFIERAGVALAFDNRVIVEQYLPDITELNCGALGVGTNVMVSEVEQPIGWKQFLTYDDKYHASKTLARRNLPAKIPQDVSAEIKRLTEQAFIALGLSGVVRIDFMLSSTGEVFLNEINTIPGSLAAYLFRYSGLSETELVTRLVDIALNEERDEAGLSFSYKSPLIGK